MLGIIMGIMGIMLGIMLGSGAEPRYEMRRALFNFICKNGVLHSEAPRFQAPADCCMLMINQHNPTRASIQILPETRGAIASFESMQSQL